MKLIQEDIDNVEYLQEEENGKKSLYIRGRFLCGEERNKNGRFYPIGLLEREVARYTQECIREDKALGEFSHPNTPTLNLDRVCMKF